MSSPCFHTEGPSDYCGPATPGFPFESPGLGSSAFARHYLRNHGCFLFLRVLRWFTSPSSLVHPMYSDVRNECSHSLGFPIRKSPDHSLLAASRGLSQLIASFIAFLRQGIHTHALSSLTIKSTSHTTERYCSLRFVHQNLCFVCPSKYSVVKDRLFLRFPGGERQSLLSSGFCLLFRFGWWAQVELNHRPHPYQGCALAI